MDLPPIIVLSGPKDGPKDISMLQAGFGGLPISRISLCWGFNDPEGVNALKVMEAAPAGVQFDIYFLPQPPPDSWPTWDIDGGKVIDLQDARTPALLSMFYKHAFGVLDEAGFTGRVFAVSNCPIAGYDNDAECGPRAYDKNTGRIDEQWAAAGFRPTLFITGFAACTEALTSQPWIAEHGIMIKQPWFNPGDNLRVQDDGSVSGWGKEPDVFGQMLAAVDNATYDAALDAAVVPTVFMGGALTPFDAASFSKLGHLIIQLHGFDTGRTFNPSMFPRVFAEAVALAPDGIELHRDMVPLLAAAVAALPAPAVAG